MAEVLAMPLYYDWYCIDVISVLLKKYKELVSSIVHWQSLRLNSIQMCCRTDTAPTVRNLGDGNKVVLTRQSNKYDMLLQVWQNYGHVKNHRFLIWSLMEKRIFFESDIQRIRIKKYYQTIGSKIDSSEVWHQIIVWQHLWCLLPTNIWQRGKKKFLSVR